MSEAKVFLNNNSGYRLLAVANRSNSNAIEGNDIVALDKFVSENKGDYIFGFMSYDLKNQIEDLTSNNLDRIGFPCFYFFIPQLLVKIDDSNGFEYLIGEKSQSNDKLVLEFLGEESNDSRNAVKLDESLNKAEYLERIQLLKEHIQKGDIYEVTYCQEFFSENAKINPVATYFKLNSKTNAPFSSYIQFGEKHLMSGSPERFINRIGDKIMSQPIKGTARRSVDEQEDNQIKKELLENPKERSENVMIVDLVRNDLSKIASKNSVEVEELFGVYTFNTVHQLISTISANIKQEVTFGDIIRALFPMGSMTGAPKIKAMELIEKYETFKRGLFSGTVGYIKPNGDFDFNVIIRSILYNEETNQLTCPVGGAITIQSDPEKEYEECLLKVEALKAVLNE